MAAAICSRTRLLAAAEQHLGELRLGHGGEPLGGRHAVRPVHAHIEGALLRETEAALRHIQLWRGDSEVEEDAGDSPPGEPMRRNSGEVLEAGMFDRESRVTPKLLASVSHRVRVLVQSE